MYGCYYLHTSRDLVSPVCRIISNSLIIFFVSPRFEKQDKCCHVTPMIGDFFFKLTLKAEGVVFHVLCNPIGVTACRCVSGAHRE